MWLQWCIYTCYRNTTVVGVGATAAARTTDIEMK